MISIKSTRTKSRRNSALLALAALLLASAPQARASDEVAAAKASFQKTVDDTLAILNDKAISKDERLHKLENIAIDRFDFPRMTQLVLGKNRSQLSAEQQREFEEEFRRSLSLTYGKRLEGYTSNEKIEIGDGRLEANKDVTVRTRISGGSAPPDGVQIDYRMRANGDKWLVIDVIPEGVSLIQNFRSQVQEIVTQKGVNQLIPTLHEKNESRQQAARTS